MSMIYSGNRRILVVDVFTLLWFGCVKCVGGWTATAVIQDNKRHFEFICIYIRVDCTEEIVNRSARTLNGVCKILTYE